MATTAGLRLNGAVSAPAMCDNENQQVQSPTIGGSDLAEKSLRGQLQWEKNMKDIDLKRRYRKVSVILIHWEKEDGVDSQKAQEEIDRLRNVFANTYNFVVKEAKLGTDERGRTPQAYIQKELVNFIWEEDQKETLIIVYAAGHGIPLDKAGQILLSGETEPDQAQKNFNSIIWTQAEHLIRQAILADVFLILDCCYAGELLFSRSKIPWSDHIFDFLGACGHAETTSLPGQTSFTAALTWALEQLAEIGIPFLSSELLEKIREYHLLPRTQSPCLFPRGAHSVRKLILEPLWQDGAESPKGLRRHTTNTQTPEDAEMRYGLKLNFLLPNILNDAELEALSTALKGLLTTAPISAKQIEWKGYYSLTEMQPEMLRVVKGAAMQWQNQQLKRRIKKLSMSFPTRPGRPKSEVPSHNISDGLLTPALSEQNSDGDAQTPVAKPITQEFVLQKFLQSWTETLHRRLRTYRVIGFVMIFCLISALIIDIRLLYDVRQVTSKLLQNILGLARALPSPVSELPAQTIIV